jgi:DNA (cytosine-5)-methyltransferase 1
MADKSRYPRISKRAKENVQGALPKIISLFSGAGGLDYGFLRAGFDIIAAFDISKAAVKTHKRNFPNSKAVADDLSKLRPAGVVKLIRSHLLDGSKIGVIGGPPCQGFSRANTRANGLHPVRLTPA